MVYAEDIEVTLHMTGDAAKVIEQETNGAVLCVGNNCYWKLISGSWFDDFTYHATYWFNGDTNYLTDALDALVDCIDHKEENYDEELIDAPF